MTYFDGLVNGPTHLSDSEQISFASKVPRALPRPSPSPQMEFRTDAPLVELGVRGVDAHGSSSRRWQYVL